mmetsp:Transcript_27232/g.36167  ORF Transcript_27232/g.36167 Transcript_27232/m.36167 type:complete len:86 (-) Transcript_27232:229-486(-)
MCCFDGQWLNEVRKLTAVDISRQVEIASQLRLPHHDWKRRIRAWEASLSGGMASMRNPEQYGVAQWEKVASSSSMLLISAQAKVD